MSSKHLNSNELNKFLSDEASAVVYKDLPPPQGHTIEQQAIWTAKIQRYTD